MHLTATTLHILHAISTGRSLLSDAAPTYVHTLSLHDALPILIPVLGLDDYQYGALAGMTVYAVPQVIAATFPVGRLSGEVGTDRKSTRLNSSHLVISYAVFCLKKKNGASSRPGMSRYSLSTHV